MSESLTNKLPGAGVQTSFVHSSISALTLRMLACMRLALVETLLVAPRGGQRIRRGRWQIIEPLIELERNEPTALPYFQEI